MTTSTDSERAAAAAESAGEPPPGKRILVVEDDPGLMELYRLLLHSGGYRVLAAEDGEEALEMFAREGRRIDLMIADVGLPRVGAVEMLVRMKSGGWLPRILICSGAVEYEVELQLRAAGAKWFLPKPFRNREMLGEIERILLLEPTGRS